MHKAIQAAINAAENIVITSHKSPDGDSIGSSMGLYQWIKRQGKNPRVVHPDPYPNFLSWVSDIGAITNLETQPEESMDLISQADLIFALDYNHPSRIGGLSEAFMNSSAKKVMIDHHLNPADMADIVVSKPEVCSTAQLVFELIDELNPEMLDGNIGTPLYLGIMTDTGSFRFSSVQPRTHEILAKLLACGVKHTHVHEQVFDQVTLSQLQLKSYAINQKLEILESGKVAILSLTQAELDQYGYEKGDTEGLVNTALAIKGVKMAIFLKENDEAVKISFRSKHNVEVNKFAGDHFDGGGHAYAAGGISFNGMDQTLEIIRQNVSKYL